MEINLKESIAILRRRLWILVVCVLVSTVLSVMYGNKSYRPIYQASTKLIVNSSVGDQLGKEQMDFGAIGVSIALISTYKEIIKSPAIMDKVVQRYPDLGLSSDQLIAIVSVNDLNDTQIMAISAKDYYYERAVRIVNAVSEVFQAEISKIMKVDNVTILNRAKMKDNPSPINSKSNQFVVLAFAASIVVGVGIIFLLEALDDSLRTEDDVRQAFGVPTLAAIPKMKDKEIRTSKQSVLAGKAGEAYAAADN